MSDTDLTLDLAITRQALEIRRDLLAIKAAQERERLALRVKSRTPSPNPNAEAFASVHVYSRGRW